jgi:hypothetical protein
VRGVCGVRCARRKVGAGLMRLCSAGCLEVELRKQKETHEKGFESHHICE